MRKSNGFALIALLAVIVALVFGAIRISEKNKFFTDKNYSNSLSIMITSSLKEWALLADYQCSQNDLTGVDKTAVLQALPEQVSQYLSINTYQPPHSYIEVRVKGVNKIIYNSLQMDLKKEIRKQGLNLNVSTSMVNNVMTVTASRGKLLSSFDNGTRSDSVIFNTISTNPNYSSRFDGC